MTDCPRIIMTAVVIKGYQAWSTWVGYLTAWNITFYSYYIVYSGAVQGNYTRPTSIMTSVKIMQVHGILWARSIHVIFRLILGHFPHSIQSPQCQAALEMSALVTTKHATGYLRNPTTHTHDPQY